MILCGISTTCVFPLIFIIRLFVALFFSPAFQSQFALYAYTIIYFSYPSTSPDCPTASHEVWVEEKKNRQKTFNIRTHSDYFSLCEFVNDRRFVVLYSGIHSESMLYPPLLFPWKFTFDAFSSNSNTFCLVNDTDLYTFFLFAIVWAHSTPHNSNQSRRPIFQCI